MLVCRERPDTTQTTALSLAELRPFVVVIHSLIEFRVVIIAHWRTRFRRVLFVRLGRCAKTVAAHKVRHYADRGRVPALLEATPQLGAPAALMLGAKEELERRDVSVIETEKWDGHDH